MPPTEKRAKTCGMRLVALGASLGILLIGNARADTDSLNDMLGPREIAVGEAMRGASTGATAVGMNPSGLPLVRLFEL